MEFKWFYNKCVNLLWLLLWNWKWKIKNVYEIYTVDVSNHIVLMIMLSASSTNMNFG